MSPQMCKDLRLGGLLLQERCASPDGNLYRGDILQGQCRKRVTYLQWYWGAGPPVFYRFYPACTSGWPSPTLGKGESSLVVKSEEGCIKTNESQNQWKHSH